MPTHKNERRPGGRAAPVPVYSGWAPLPCAVWMEVAETFAKPWSRPVACADLTTYQSVAIQPVDPVRFPSIGDLTERWGWSAHEVRRLLTDETAWSDPTLTGNGDRAARWAAIKDARTSRSGSHGSRTDRARIEHGSRKDATVEPAESTSKAHGFNEDRARIEITSLNTRVGSQSTEHRAQTQEKHAPAPAVADLFASLASQTSADTGKATTGGERSAGVAEPAKAKRSRRGPSPEAVAAWPVALAWWAKMRPDNAARLKMDRGDGAFLLEALDKQGVDVIVGRLRQAAVGTGYMARQVRGEVPGRDAVDGLPALLRQGTGITRPLDSAAESEGYDVPMDPAARDPRAIAVEAWANMMLDPRWKSVCMPGNAPNAPGDFGNPTRWDLADTAEEHDRRMTCFRLAGSIPKWRDADAEGRRQFRERWIELYAKEVTA